MNSAVSKSFGIILGFVLALCASGRAQQDTGPIQGNAGQASQPEGATSGPGNPGASINAASPAASGSSPTAPEVTNPSPDTGAIEKTRTDKAAPPSDNAAPKTSTAMPNADWSAPRTDNNTPESDRPRTILAGGSGDDNPWDPLLEPPALPKGKPTLIGGTAARIDHVRNLLTIEPLGGGPKVKMFMDERTHIYRNAAETTVLGIHKGDRVYADTMLDGARVFAKNVRVENQTGAAEVRGQVLAVNRDKGKVSVKDELSSQPVTFAIDDRTRYSAFKGTASSFDLHPGSIIDVQFAPARENRDVAQEVILLARPGDTYVFSGVVTNIDLRSGTLALDNRSDDQTYELHFSQAAVDDRSQLKVGSEVTAHAVFDGKQYKANDVRVQQTTAAEDSKPE